MPAAPILVAPVKDGTILAAIEQELQARACAAEAVVLLRFFKTGPGEYGAGDRFRGIRVPALRQLVPRFAGLSLAGIVRLLAAPHHEDRLLALLLLVRRFEQGDAAEQARVVAAYLQQTSRINNWDLVDLSAPNIIGPWVAGQGVQLLQELARSTLLWERRIAMVATLHLIRRGRYAPTLALARRFCGDSADLMHKAAGWMLREVGKRDEAVLRRFVARHGTAMPRTMLRYAIERFEETERKVILLRTSRRQAEAD